MHGFGYWVRMGKWTILLVTRPGIATGMGTDPTTPHGFCWVDYETYELMSFASVSLRPELE